MDGGKPLPLERCEREARPPRERHFEEELHERRGYCGEHRGEHAIHYGSRGRALLSSDEESQREEIRPLRSQNDAGGKAALSHSLGGKAQGGTRGRREGRGAPRLDEA